MILFQYLDKTAEASPVVESLLFADKAAMLRYMGFDEHGRQVGDEDDCPYGLDEQSIGELLEGGVAFHDSSEIYTIEEISLKVVE